ncbi:restriction endonuclease subunit S [Kroppenstedtia eburnea]|uniref:Type I restriction enzyme, S subunit n=1 Tax=Kroppenstedtia eburnea TaxID=714067 RepID=A0A1N7Q0B0_9BACL|nr:restriction endonuclease subunit S [Kroppenstedtia eburnea]QKI81084.1 hypothetical protein GXN75_03215 [Kroppenstedtia eburnea]SIT16333.1 type I restriction enzyme, S subunit [Kroppenstedtia eburnea]
MSRKKKQTKTLEELLEEALVPEEEQPYELPENWVWVRLGSVGQYHNGRAFKSKEWSEKGRPIIRIQDLTGSYNNPNFFEGVVESRHEVHPGDLLVSWSATLGVYMWNGPEAVLNQHIFKVDSYIDRKYHYYALKNTINNMRTRGTGMVHVTKKVFESTPFPLPPLSEQKRIVDRVESLLGKIDEAKELIQKARDSFEQRRAAILDRAFRGELTRTWREQHPDVESADHLLERIREEKASMETQKGGRRKKAVDLSPINPPYELPQGWKWVRLGDIMSFQNGISKRNGTAGDLTVVLRLADIREFEFVEDSFRKIMLTDAEQRKYKVSCGDLLYIRVNGSKDLVGKACLYDFDYDVAFCDHLIRGETNRNIDLEFMWFISNSPVFREQLSDKIVSSAGQNTISQSSLGSTIIPLPPIGEQKEVVKTLKSLFSLQKDVEEVLLRESELDSLTQSILTQAFRGELGTHDPTEESALELLKRTLAEQNGLAYESPATEELRVAEQGELYLT